MLGAVPLANPSRLYALVQSVQREENGMVEGGGEEDGEGGAKMEMWVT